MPNTSVTLWAPATSQNLYPILTYINPIHPGLWPALFYPGPERPPLGSSPRGDGSIMGATLPFHKDTISATSCPTASGSDLMRLHFDKQVQAVDCSRSNPAHFAPSPRTYTFK